MHYILRVGLPGFFVGELRKRFPGLAGQALVVHRGKVVIDACELARGRGVAVGIGVSQAKTILRGGAFREWIPSDYERASRAWLDVCADFSGVVEPEGQDAAWLDLLGHPDPLRTAQQAVDAIERRAGIRPRWAVANSKWLSTLLAERGGALDLMQPTVLSPAQPEHLARLEFLGYRTVGQVAEIPLDDLRQQFGEEGVTIHQAARGGCIDEVRRAYPPNSVTEQLYFAGSLESWELLLGALQYLSEHLSESLRAKDLAGHEIRIALDTEGGVERLHRRFTKGMQSAPAILAALKLMTFEAIGEPVLGMRVLMPRLSRAERVQQPLIGRKPNARLLSVELALRQLRSVYGETAVRRASEIEVPRRARVLRVWKDVTGWA